MSTIIGYIFDKQGNIKNVYAPVNASLQEVKKKSRTKFGKIPNSVGYPGFTSTEKWVK